MNSPSKARFIYLKECERNENSDQSAVIDQDLLGE